MNQFSLFRFLFLFLAAISFASFSGCYPDWPGHESTATVEGEFTLDGFPLRNSKVVFVPVRLKSASGKLTQIAYGECDSYGVFKLAYADGSHNILAGRYKVFISHIKDEEEGEANKIGSTDNSANSLNELLDQNQSVPAIYNRESDLEYEIVPSPAIVRCKFELSSIDPLLVKNKSSKKPDDK